MREIQFNKEDFKPDHSRTCLMCALGFNEEEHERAEKLMEEMDEKLFQNIKDPEISSSMTIVELAENYSTAELAMMLEGVVYALSVEKGYIKDNKGNPIKQIIEDLKKKESQPRTEQDLFKSLLNDVKDKKNL